MTHILAVKLLTVFEVFVPPVKDSLWMEPLLFRCLNLDGLALFSEQYMIRNINFLCS